MRGMKTFFLIRKNNLNKKKGIITDLVPNFFVKFNLVPKLLVCSI